MDELIKSRMHEAFEVRPPAGLRTRVIASVPMTVARQRRSPRRSSKWFGHWLGGAVATVIAIAVIGALIYSRSALGTVGSGAGAEAPRPLPVWPEGVAVAPDGTVYVSDIVGGRVFKLDPKGRLVTIAGGGLGGDGLATKAWLTHPAGLAVDANGDVYVAESQGAAIRRIDSHGRISTLVADPSNFYAPLGLAFNGGALYVSLPAEGNVRRIGPDQAVTTLDTSSLAPPVWQPSYLTFDATGNLYVADRAPGPTEDPIARSTAGGCRIVRVSADGKAKVVAGTGTCGFSGDGGPAVSAQLNNPNGMAFDSNGNLYFADTYNHRIRRIDTSGVITTVAGTGTAGYLGDGGLATQAELGYPLGLGIASSNLLYIADASCWCTNPTTAGHLRLLNLSIGLMSTAGT